MGKLQCKVCGAEAEASTIAKADSLIDHSLGRSHGVPCPGDPSNLIWEGKPAFEKKYVPANFNAKSVVTRLKARLTHKKPKQQQTQKKTTTS